MNVALTILITATASLVAIASIYDLVVGADGVRSWVRTVVLGGGAPRSVGQASWRFLVDGFPEVTAWTVRLGRGKSFLTIPLGDGRIYCYADVNAEATTLTQPRSILGSWASSTASSPSRFQRS